MAKGSGARWSKELNDERKDMTARGVEQAVEASALAESLNRFLEGLPQEKRVLFVRRYWYLCSIEELAAWSGKRRGTVSAELFRLRARLREHLEKEGFDL